MEHTVEKLSGNKVKISFTASAEDFQQAIEKAYLKLRGQIAVPGFRKGKAPRKLIERMYGAGIFYEDALEILFPDAYAEAVEKNDIHPVDRPELDNVEQMEEGKDLKFSCEVFVMPEVTLGDYKGVEVTRPVRKVGAEEVDNYIEQERKRVARSEEITDRALENGDKANLDYSGSVDGVKFDGGTAQNQTLLIGSGTFIPGFEEQMVGMTIGEEKDLTVKFPEEYHAENLKGKEAVFHVKLNGITREELPVLDDDFAAEVSDFDTLAEYRAGVHAAGSAASERLQRAETGRIPRRCGKEPAGRRQCPGRRGCPPEAGGRCGWQRSGGYSRSHGGKQAGRHDAGNVLAHAAAGLQHGTVHEDPGQGRKADARHVP